MFFAFKLIYEPKTGFVNITRCVNITRVFGKGIWLRHCC